MREGQSRRAPIERIVDIVTGYFVPIVTLLALITWIIWLALGFGGALPPDYLDIEVGGWGESQAHSVKLCPSIHLLTHACT